MSYFSTRALRWAAPVALVGALGLAACGNSDSEAIRTAAPSAAGVGSDQHLSNKAEELAGRSASVGSDQHLSNKATELAQEQRAYREAASVGSDQHLSNKAEELAGRSASVGSDQHLKNQAAEIASQRADRAASDRLTGLAEQMQRAQAARLAASAEWNERSAHLEGLAETYSKAVPTNSDANLPNVWEAGNKAVYRALQKAQADAYVDWLEARAEPTSNRDALAAQAQAYVDSLVSRAESGSTSSHDFLPGSHHVPVR